MDSSELYSHAALKALQPNVADFMMMLNMGENYGKQLATFINAHFEVLNFTCDDNDIVKTFKAIVSSGHVQIRLSHHAVNKYMLSVEYNSQFVELPYSTFDTFTKALELIAEKLSFEKY